MPQTNYRMNTTASLVVVAGITIMLTAFGVSGAIASEITGTLSTTGTSGGRSSTGSGSTATSSSSTGGGTISGTVVGGTSASNPNAPIVASSGGGISGSTRHRATIAGSNTGTAPASTITPTPSSDASLTGTGGGYDPNLDSYLASLNSRGSSASAGSSGGISGSNLSPSDAVAYNGGVNPNALKNAAAVGSASTTGKIMTIILVALAILGLAWYAIRSYLAYRREREL